MVVVVVVFVAGVVVAINIRQGGDVTAPEKEASREAAPRGRRGDDARLQEVIRSSAGDVGLAAARSRIELKAASG